LFHNAYAEQSVLVTGHTGFKGSWLCYWLSLLGARVAGFALDPAPEQRLFNQLELGRALQQDHRGDIRSLASVTQAISQSQPRFIFHLAAQSLVRASYDEPIETFETNVMGVANVLQACREIKHPCFVVVITTDKCYENREWLHAYREEEPLGGYDPYSASKACAELVVSSYRRSFFPNDSPVRIATARAGNVIGGGDWAQDRIVPDCMRAVRSGLPVEVRNKSSTRPWQHVLDPLSGYLWLAALLEDPHRNGLAESGVLCNAFNFGPELTSNRTVGEVVQYVLAQSGGQWLDRSDPSELHEAGKLNLAIEKAFHLLGWLPTWNFETTIKHTVQWYLREQDGESPVTISRQQIESYENDARARNLPWTTK
jgi:CDP-glucose 4,6-dehydratase